MNEVIFLRINIFSCLVVSFILLSSGCIQSNNNIELFGTEYKNPPDAPDFTLLNQDGESVTLSDYSGKVVVVAFIYTSCPDVCLAISSNLAWIYANLGEYSDDVEILSITIDPARDTVERFAFWTEANGYEWNHLSAERSSTLVNVWNDWNIVVDNEHIEASTPPEDTINRVVFLNSSNETIVVDILNNNFQHPDTVTDLDNKARDLGDVNFSTDGWGLMNWNHTSWAWQEVGEDYLEQYATHDKHLAWVASGANTSLLPLGVDCNGHGWVMGEGGSAHCMCDEGYERPDGNWLGCILIGTDDSNSSDSVNPHEESLGEYGVGHSTVTFILDKQTRKRVAWTGIDWNVQEFLLDIQALSSE